jgi:hypothetical protein
MDKLYSKKSRLGFMSVLPALTVALIVLLVIQQYRAYLEVVSFYRKISPELLGSLHNIYRTNFIVSFSLIVFFCALFFGVYVFEKIRRKKQNEVLSNTIKGLSFISMIKENNPSMPRNKI